MDASVLWMSRGSRGDLLSTFMDVAATTLALQVFSLVKQVRERAVNAGVRSTLRNIIRKYVAVVRFA